jgi:hypothetical protein
MVNMSRRPTLVTLVCIALIAGGVACVLLGIITPLDRPQINPSSATEHPSRRAVPTPALSDFEPLFALDLRKPLVDSPKIDPAAEALTTDSPLPIRLSGTIIEPGRDIAVFSTGLSKTVLRHVGDDVNGAEVLTITPDSVTLRYQGQLRQLKLEKSAIAPAPLSATPPTPDGG